MAIQSHGTRMTDDTRKKLDLLRRVTGKQQYSILAVAVDQYFASELQHPIRGPVLRAMEAMEWSVGDGSRPEG